MTVADGSQTRLADVTEVTIGTTPATPAFQVMRYASSDVRLVKQTEIPDEIRADRNVASIVDVGRMVQGNINTLLSYGTYDVWLERLLASSWAADVLKNGIADKAGTLEWTYEQGATDTYIRTTGNRWNTLDLQLTARQSVRANWGIMGITSPAPTSAIIAGATYAAATTTPVLNAGLNVGALAITGMANAPKVQAMNLRITNNVYQNDVLGQYFPHSHGLGRFEVSGSMTTLFENLDTYNAILAHDDIAIAITLGATTLQKYTIALPKVKLMDGGPVVGGNGRAVILEVPFQAYYDSVSAASMSVTRAVV